MFETKVQYHAVHGVDPEDDCSSSPRNPPAPRYIPWIGYIVLAVSLIANVGLLVANTRHSSSQCGVTKSKYAGLEYDTPRPFITTTEFSDMANITRTQMNWDSMNFDAGMIYITPEHAASMELLGAQSFPWDPELKIYLLNSHHNLHCIQSIQRSIIDLYANPHRPPTYDLHHVMHCLDNLRDDVLCHADDTPRYTTASDKRETGMGQMRMCRDWSKYMEWAEKYSGCWRYIDKQHDYSTEIWRWIYCPRDSPWAERIGKWAKKHEKERPEGTPEP